MFLVQWEENRESVDTQRKFGFLQTPNLSKNTQWQILQAHTILSGSLSLPLVC